MSNEHNEEESLQERVQELQESLARTQADYANYRKRTEREREEHKTQATQHLVKEILGVVDHLELALAQQQTTKEELKQGVELVLSQLITILEDYGVERISAEEFDPHLHEALIKEPSKQPKGTILEVLQPGYKLGKKILRSAKVKVSQGPEETNNE